MNSTTTFLHVTSFFFPPKPRDNSLVRERKLLQEKQKRSLMKNSSEALEEKNFMPCPSIGNRETTKLVERISSVMYLVSQSTCSITCNQKISGQNQTLRFDWNFQWAQIVEFYNKINIYMQRYIQTKSIKMYTHLSLKSRLNPI